MKMGKVKKITGLSESTLRYYEESGLIEPARNENSYRDYSKYDVMKIIDAHKCLKHGMTVRQYREEKCGEKLDIDMVKTILSDNLKQNRNQLNHMIQLIRYQEHILQEIEEAKHLDGNYKIERLKSMRIISEETVSQHILHNDSYHWMDYNEFYDMMFIAKTNDVTKIKPECFAWNRMIESRFADALDECFLTDLPEIPGGVMLIKYVETGNNPIHEIIRHVKEANEYACNQNMRLTGRIVGQSFLFSSEHYFIKLCMELKENQE